MTSDPDNQSQQPVRLPFGQPIARRMLEEFFGSQSLWKTSELRERVTQLHRERGGFTQSDPKSMIQRALQDLKSAGLVCAPSHGYVQWTGASQEGGINPYRATEASVDEESDQIDDLEPVVRPEKEVGTGTECVYMYFNPNEKELEQLKGYDVWECKIGRTSNYNAVPRILSQGVRTAFSHLPIVGLVLRTEDSLALETALHSSLKLVGAEVPNAPGSEWFITSPALVETWYENFQKALAAIDRSSTQPDVKTSL